MDATLEQMEMFRTLSNIVILPITEEDKDRAPVNQVHVDTAACVASLVTVSARKALSMISSTYRPQSRKKESGMESPNPVTPNVMKRVAHENVKSVTKIPPANKMTGAGQIMSQESTQVDREGNLFDLGTMPESDDTKIIPIQDTPTAETNEKAIALIEPPTKVHGNDGVNPGKTAAVTGNTSPSYKAILQGGQDTERNEEDRDIKTVKDTFVTVKEGEGIKI